MSSCLSSLARTCPASTAGTHAAKKVWELALSGFGLKLQVVGDAAEAKADG